MIAISYRREDSLPVAGRLYDRLQAKFGKDRVFMDFDSIRPGLDFRQQIEQTIERASVVVAIVGPKWLGERASAGRRIDEPGDFVRLEIAHALKRNVPVIPLLVDDTVMPGPETLPADLREFAFRHALPLDSGVDFHHHADRLMSGISDLLPRAEQPATSARPHENEPPKKGAPSRWLIFGGGAFLLMVAAISAWKMFAPANIASPNESSAPTISAPGGHATQPTASAKTVMPSEGSLANAPAPLRNPADVYLGVITLRGQSEAGSGRQLSIILDSDLKAGEMTQSSKRGDFVVKFYGNWRDDALHAVTTEVVAQPAGIEWAPESFVLRFSEDGKNGSYECISGGKTYVAQLNGQKRASDARTVYEGPIKKAGSNDPVAGLRIRFAPDRRSGTETQTSRLGDTVVRFSGVWDGNIFRAVTDDVISKPEKIQWTPESFVIRFDNDWRNGIYECRAGPDLYTAQLSER
jgi:hypothetical protein